MLENITELQSSDAEERLARITTLLNLAVTEIRLLAHSNEQDDNDSDQMTGIAGSIGGMAGARHVRLARERQTHEQRGR
jgi:hypothetical protein